MAHTCSVSPEEDSYKYKATLGYSVSGGSARVRRCIKQNTTGVPDQGKGGWTQHYRACAKVGILHLRQSAHLCRLYPRSSFWPSPSHLWRHFAHWHRIQYLHSDNHIFQKNKKNYSIFSGFCIKANIWGLDTGGIWVSDTLRNLITPNQQTGPGC